MEAFTMGQESAMSDSAYLETLGVITVAKKGV